MKKTILAWALWRKTDMGREFYHGEPIALYPSKTSAVIAARRSAYKVIRVRVTIIRGGK